MLLLLITIIAGALTILAPCVLPLLPIIIGGSIGGGKKDRARPYVIAGGLAVSIIGFTLLLKVSTALIGLSPNVLNYVSGGIIIALGLVSVLPEVWEKLIIDVNWQATSQRFLGRTEHDKRRYIGPALIGVALGPVFSSCSPTYAFILASVLPRSFGSGLVYLTAYSLALVLTLLAVSLTGRKSLANKQWIIDTHSNFRRAIGVVFIIVGAVIISGQQVKVETWIGNHLPFDETKIERFLLASQTPHLTKSKTPTSSKDVLNVQSTPAPELVGLTNWINSSPRTLAQLRGKVVLVDFWTYSCVNCNRALPNVEKWYQAYSKDGFEVIGVHTPEFAFEHDPTNVANAVKSDGITYPVALDNNYDTWNAFDNDSWPADYLIDKDGNIRYVALGEGSYNVTDEAIQELLGIHQALATPNSNVPFSQSQSPETYFGTARTTGYQGTPALTDGTHDFTAQAPVASLDPSGWTLSGSWTEADQMITSNSDTSTLTYRSEAKDTYVVAGSANNQPQNVSVQLSGDGANDFGVDAPNGTAVISGSRLYHIASLPKFGDTTITLTVPKGVSLYTFTFGS
jgi:cytochrome c biogenesis protein CcdA/thiol-disulfide isomerase/thioredoxin